MLEAILQCSVLVDAYYQSLVKCAHKFPAISHTMDTRESRWLNVRVGFAIVPGLNTDQLLTVLQLCAETTN